MPSPDIVSEVFIDPIKSVLFIDDEYPVYSDLFSKQDNHEDSTEDLHLLKEIKEDEEDFESPEDTLPLDRDSNPDENNSTSKNSLLNIFDLTQSCRKNGFIFDVEKKPSELLDNDPEILNKPDLIVLDYILNPETLSCDDSLNILSKLNKSDRFNLVILYTAEEPKKVLVQAAYALRKSPKAKIPVPQKDYVEKYSSHIEENISTSNPLAYLNSRTNGSEFIDFFGLPEGTTKDKATVVRSCFEKHLAKNYPNQVRHGKFEVECSTGESNYHWIKGKNVFISIVQKDPTKHNDISSLLEVLKNSLIEYSPTPVTMLLQQGVTTFRSATIESMKEILGSSEKRAAILFNSMSSEQHSISGNLEEIRAAELSKWTLSSFASSVHNKLKDFSCKLYKTLPTINITTASTDELIALALKQEKANWDTEPRQLVMMLNSMLCSSQFSGTHLTNGTIFRSTNKKEYYICSTPSCDMMPRKSKKQLCYRANLYPASSFEALRIRECKIEAHTIEALDKAQNCKHIFLEVDGKPTAFQVILGDGGGEPRPHSFYAANGNFIKDNKIELTKVGLDSERKLSLISIEAEPIAQLKPDYAGRLLMQKGNHNSRIGVDFSKYPSPSLEDYYAQYELSADDVVKCPPLFDDTHPVTAHAVAKEAKKRGLSPEQCTPEFFIKLTITGENQVATA